MNILLANSDFNFGYVLKRELEEHSFYVDVVADGLEAIINFVEKEYCFIIIDVFLPKLDGIDTLKVLNALKKNHKINHNSQIITFSCDNDQHGIDSLSYGSIRYFKKPFSIELLVAFIKNTSHYS